MTLALVPHKADRDRASIWAAVAGTAGRPGDLRLTAEQHDQLAAEALGKGTNTDIVLARLFNGGMRSHDGLRKVAELHNIGMALKRLADRPEIRRDEAILIMATARRLIDKLAKTLP